MCLCFKKVSEKCYFNKLVLGEVGGGGGEGKNGREREPVVTMLLILTLDVKLQMLIINKIYIQS